jgi:Citrate synthase
MEPNINVDNNLFDRNDALISRYSDMVSASTDIAPELYSKYNVKRGLRNADGSGVLVGLTTVSSVVGYTMFEQELIPVHGKLLYRGIDVRDIVKGFQEEKRFGFEESVFLLLLGRMPTAAEHAEFCAALDSVRPLPHGFKEEAIIHLPSPDVMNKLARCVLTAYAFDDHADDNSIKNVVRQSMALISRMPTFAVYGYQAKAHYFMGQSLHMRVPEPGLSTAEHILCLLRPYSAYTRLEAEILDLCLVLHADHGGGNNSTFTTHVVSSTLTDTYSTVAAAILSLKGPRHGGANMQVSMMMEDIKANVKDWTSAKDVEDYVAKIIDKKANDRSGLIYGLGHAVYKVSDPRAEILEEKAEQLVVEHPEYADEFGLYKLVAQIGVRLLRERSKGAISVCVNVDFYSGLVYKILGIPADLFTPLFAIGRTPGWTAHRLEELSLNGKIIRPAYKCVHPGEQYLPMAQR